jgi:predicted RNA-binding protein with PUA-like domain
MTSPVTAKRPAPAPRCWLMKSEPDVFSIDDLASAGKTAWEGVRNYQARNHMRDEMRVGDAVLFYHSSADPPAVAGLARVASAAYPDPTQFDANSDYYDPKATREAPRWMLVDVEFVEKFAAPVPLAALQADAALRGMLVIQRGMRRSVQPVEPAHFMHVARLAGAKRAAGLVEG